MDLPFHSGEVLLVFYKGRLFILWKSSIFAMPPIFKMQILYLWKVKLFINIKNLDVWKQKKKQTKKSVHLKLQASLEDFPRHGKLY